MPQVCHAVDRMGDTRVLFKCATAVDCGRHVRWVHTAIPTSQRRARASSVGKTPPFSFCQVDMYALCQTKSLQCGVIDYIRTLHNKSTGEYA